MYGIDFVLVTDRKPLDASIERWILRLQPYSYRVKYEKGSNNNIADPLSRMVNFNLQRKQQNMSDTDDVYWMACEAVPKALTLEEIDCESGKDPTLIEVQRAIETNSWDRLQNFKFKILKDELCVYNQTVLSGTRIVIPKALQERVLAIVDEGHSGIVSMKNRLRSKLWWKGIDKSVLGHAKDAS